MPIRPEAVIYSDGSCLNNPGPGGWAAIVVTGGQELELFGGDTKTTNNRMELLGVINGLKALKGPHIVTVYSDSKYVTDAFNRGWLQSWKKNGWARKDGELLNAELWKELGKLVDRHSCTFVWVKGHAGNEYNERADKLALAESKRQGAGRGTPHHMDFSDDEPEVTEPVADEQTEMFTDVGGDEVFGTDDRDYAIGCLDELLKANSEAKYKHRTPCGAEPWCENCGDYLEYECAHAYIAYKRACEEAELQPEA